MECKTDSLLGQAAPSSVAFSDSDASVSSLARTGETGALGGRALVVVRASPVRQNVQSGTEKTGTQRVSACRGSVLAGGDWEHFLGGGIHKLGPATVQWESRADSLILVSVSVTGLMITISRCSERTGLE